MSSWEGWWERRFHVQRGRLEGGDLKEQGLKDEDLLSLAAYFRDKFLPESRASLKLDWRAPIRFDTLNLGKNDLGDAGVRALVDALLEHQVHVHRLWLHNNWIGEEGASAVAELIEKGAGPLDEVHLSHNQLSKFEVRKLLVATAHRRDYPLNGTRPLWLRVEHNPACENLSVDLMREADQRLASIRKEKGLLPDGVDECMICVVPWISHGCKASYCRRVHRYGPIVHLPYFWDRTKEKAKGSRGDEEKEYYTGPRSSTARGWESHAAASRHAPQLWSADQDGASQWSGDQDGASQWSGDQGGAAQRWSRHKPSAAGGDGQEARALWRGAHSDRQEGAGGQKALSASEKWLTPQDDLRAEDAQSNPEHYAPAAADQDELDEGEEALLLDELEACLRGEYRSEDQDAEQSGLHLPQEDEKDAVPAAWPSWSEVVSARGAGSEGAKLAELAARAPA